MPSQSWKQCLVSSQVAGSTLTSAAAASAIPPQAKYGMQANFIDYIGQVLEFQAFGKITLAATTPGTIRWDARFGGTVMCDTGAIAGITTAGVSNIPFSVYFYLKCSVDSNVGVFTTYVEVKSAVLTTAPAGLFQTISVPGNTVDFTSALTVDFFFTQTVGTGSQTLTEYMLTSSN